MKGEACARSTIDDLRYAVAVLRSRHPGASENLLGLVQASGRLAQVMRPSGRQVTGWAYLAALEASAWAARVACEGDAVLLGYDPESGRRGRCWRGYASQPHSRLTREIGLDAVLASIGGPADWRHDACGTAITECVGNLAGMAMLRNWCRSNPDHVRVWKTAVSAVKLSLGLATSFGRPGLPPGLTLSKTQEAG